MTDLQLWHKEIFSIEEPGFKSTSLHLEHHSWPYYDIQTACTVLLKLLAEERLTPGFSQIISFKKQGTWFAWIILKFIFLAPIYIFGQFINYLPYILPSQVFKAWKLISNTRLLRWLLGCCFLLLLAGNLAVQTVHQLWFSYRATIPLSSQAMSQCIIDWNQTV
jgi:hypothetical protein